MRNNDNINFYYCVKRKKLLKGFCFNILVASWNLDYTKRANFKIKMLPGKKVFWNTGLFVAREQTGIMCKNYTSFLSFPQSFVVLFVKTGICLEQPWGHWQHLLAIDSNWNQPPFPHRSACIFSRSGNRNWDVVKCFFPRLWPGASEFFFFTSSPIFILWRTLIKPSNWPRICSLTTAIQSRGHTDAQMPSEFALEKTELSRERVKAWNHPLCVHHLSTPQLFPSNHFSFHCSHSKDAPALCIQSEWDEKWQAGGVGRLSALNPFGCSSTGYTGAPLVPLQGENRTSRGNFSQLS